MYFSGFGFSLGGGVKVHAGEIGQGVLLVLTFAAPGANDLGGVEAWVLMGCQGRGGQEWGWLTLGFSFNFFTGGICPWFYTILDVAAPSTNVHDSGGAYFVRQGHNEYLGVEWGVYMGLY